MPAHSPEGSDLRRRGEALGKTGERREAKRNPKVFDRFNLEN
jgi:hypothetical protein